MDDLWLELTRWNSEFCSSWGYLTYEHRKLEEGTQLWTYGLRDGSVLDYVTDTPRKTLRSPSKMSEIDPVKVSLLPTLRGTDTPTEPESPAVKAQKLLHLKTLVFPVPEEAYKSSRAALGDKITKAQEGGYDANIHIVDPDKYYEHLEALHSKVIQSSALAYNDRSELLEGLWDGDAVMLEGLDTIPDWLSLSQYQMIKSMSVKDNKAHVLAHLWGTYLMICRCWMTLQELKLDSFCDRAINILVKLPALDIVEITEISIESVTSLKSLLEHGLIRILSSSDAVDLWACLRESVLVPCDSFLAQFGIRDPATNPDDIKSTLVFSRMTACLLDVAIISYVGSHSSRLDLRISKDHDQGIHLVHTKEEFQFACKAQRLACIDGMLDHEKVWVFNLPLLGYQVDEFAVTATLRPLAVLTRIHLLADIWGPVWAVPNGNDISHYNVSKGVIYRLRDQNVSGIRGAVQCHWSAQTDRSWAARAIPFASDDLLLIEGGLVKNDSCDYSLFDYASDRSQHLHILGTKPETWVLDSRGISLSLTKTIGVTIMGAQKLIPQTTVKQHALDEWTNRPEDVNPDFLNNAYGVTISHCTGNAKRIALKELLLNRALWPMLINRSSDGPDTHWHSKFQAALEDDDPEAIITFWSANRKHRQEVAALVCSALRLLDSTGHVGDNYEAALISDNERRSVVLDQKSNEWLVLLRESRRMASYVLIEDACVHMSGPSSEISSCSSGKAFTVLQTQIKMIGEDIFLGKPMRTSTDYVFQILTICITGERILVPQTLLSHVLRSASMTGREQYRQNCAYGKVTYVRSASKAYHGWKVQKKVKQKSKTAGVIPFLSSDPDRESVAKRTGPALTSPETSPEGVNLTAHPCDTLKPVVVTTDEQCNSITREGLYEHRITSSGHEPPSKSSQRLEKFPLRVSNSSE